MGEELCKNCCFYSLINHVPNPMKKTASNFKDKILSLNNPKTNKVVCSSRIKISKAKIHEESKHAIIQNIRSF